MVGYLPLTSIRQGNVFRLSQEYDDSPVILEGQLMNNTWRPVLPYEQYHSVAQRVEADGNDGEGYTDINKLLEAVENHYMVHKTSFHLLIREDLEPGPHPQAEPTATTTTTTMATSQGIAHATETADGSGHPAGSVIKADHAAWKSHVATQHRVSSDTSCCAIIMILQSIENGHNPKDLEEAHQANVASFPDGWLASFDLIRQGNVFRLSQEYDDSPVILEGQLMNNTWRPVLPYVAQRVEANGNDGEGYTDIHKLLKAVENHYMVHKTSFHLLKREDLEPVPHPQAEPTATTTTTATATSQGVAHATETADGCGHPAGSIIKVDHATWKSHVTTQH
jgi:rubrerythrin